MVVVGSGRWGGCSSQVTHRAGPTAAKHRNAPGHATPTACQQPPSGWPHGSADSVPPPSSCSPICHDGRPKSEDLPSFINTPPPCRRPHTARSQTYRARMMVAELHRIGTLQAAAAQGLVAPPPPSPRPPPASAPLPAVLPWGAPPCTTTTRNCTPIGLSARPSGMAPAYWRPPSPSPPPGLLPPFARPAGAGLPLLVPVLVLVLVLLAPGRSNRYSSCPNGVTPQDEEEGEVPPPPPPPARALAGRSGNRSSPSPQNLAGADGRAARRQAAYTCGHVQLLLRRSLRLRVVHRLWRWQCWRRMPGRCNPWECMPQHR